MSGPLLSDRPTFRPQGVVRDQDAGCYFRRLHEIRSKVTRETVGVGRWPPLPRHLQQKSPKDESSSK